VQRRVEGLSGGIDFLDARFLEHALELRGDHLHAGAQGLEAGVVGRAGGVQGGLKVVHHRDELFEQCLVGVTNGVLAFAGGAFAEVLEVGVGADVLLPVLLGLGGLGLELGDVFGRQRFRRGCTCPDRGLSWSFSSGRGGDGICRRAFRMRFCFRVLAHLVQLPSIQLS
jgi:hypothetical protein